MNVMTVDQWNTTMKFTGALTKLNVISEEYMRKIHVKMIVRYRNIP